MSEKHIVTLTGDQVAHSQTLLCKGKTSARRLKRANILGFADKGYSDEEIHDLTDASLAPTVEATSPETRDDVSMARLSPDGKRIVSVASDLTLRLWDVATGKLSARLNGQCMSRADPTYP